MWSKEEEDALVEQNRQSLHTLASQHGETIGSHTARSVAMQMALHTLYGRRDRAALQDMMPGRRHEPALLPPPAIAHANAVPTRDWLDRGFLGGEQNPDMLGWRNCAACGWHRLTAPGPTTLKKPEFLCIPCINICAAEQREIDAQNRLEALRKDPCASRQSREFAQEDVNFERGVRVHLQALLAQLNTNPIY